MTNFNILKSAFVALLLIISADAFAQINLNTPGVESKLYLSTGKNQPLIVGLGGSEGGNAWASDHWRNTRDQFLEKGYAFLALGYFNAEGAPDTLNRISINQVHDAILAATKDPGINKNKIAIIGGSRGADLALLLGSYYKDISCIVAIVPSYAAFPGHTNHFTTSAWTFNGKELPFVPVNEEAVPALMKGDLRATFEAMIKDTVAVEKARIRVENINGPLLFLSATRDEIAPTTPMSVQMMARLKTANFPYHFEHVAIEGGHAEPLKHFDLVFKFLDQYFLKE